MYPSPLRDDGYDISDYYNIHPDYGTLDDFKKLIAEAKKRGIRIITDLVMNHTSDMHPWFQSARQSKDSPYRDWYVWSDTDDKYTETRIIFLDTEPSNWTYDEVAGQYFWHRFYRTQPDLNWDNPAVIEEFKNIARFWLSLGLDGFRADAVPYLIEREGTSNENLPETHVILKDFRALHGRRISRVPSCWVKPTCGRGMCARILPTATSSRCASIFRSCRACSWRSKKATPPMCSTSWNAPRHPRQLPVVHIPAQP
jgi:maltose alpha-D-glucosyltransferase / alpha-amylase